VGELEAARSAAEALLRHGVAVPEGPFVGLAAFAPVRAVPSRHGCVLLPFEALRAAIAGAREPS
jgi:NifU-like protein involved in Fe-S cluster formation